jgi:DNA-binding MarR family transcriptional regulator
MPHHHHPPHDPFEPALEGVDPLSVDVFRAFKRSVILNRHLMMLMLAEEDTHPAQAGCLLALSRADGIGQSDLATMLHVSRPTVTAMLQKMEAAEVIERRADEHDQRVTRIFLTPLGRQRAERMREVHARIIASTVGELPEADRAELLRLLETLNERAAATLKQASIDGQTAGAEGDAR